ncbi:Calcium-binding protein NCS-1 [Hypoxylon texense]
MALSSLLDQLGPEILDPEEETFLLFSQDIPSQNLGFVDPRSATLDLNVAGKDFVIHQSPTILNRPGSTTGAVVWKITPLVADWLAASDNLFFATGVLSSSSAVLELGCGISGLVGLVLAPLVARYTLTDQSYVARLVEKNIGENSHLLNAKQLGNAPQKRKGKPLAARPRADVQFVPLDWELDEVTPSLTGDGSNKSFDAVVACDCIYNESLIKPLVQACADACRLGRADESSNADRPAVCLVAQQLRDPAIFEGWIQEFSRYFRVWRVPHSALSKELRSNPGFVVHLGILQTTGELHNQS